MKASELRTPRIYSWEYVSVDNVIVFVRSGISFSKFDYSSKIILRPWYGKMYMYSDYLQNTVGVFEKSVKDFLVEFFKESCCGIDKNDYITVMVSLKEDKKKIV